MSYCVNCGVELDTNMKTCPLCNTPVINPNQLSEGGKKSAFPNDRGQVDVVKRKDFVILISVILLATGATCGILNLLVFNQTRWSLLIIGGCILLWVLFVPVLLYEKLSAYFSILFDGIAIGFYLYLITLVTRNDNWLYGLAFPITGLAVVTGEALAFCFKKLPMTFLTTALYIFSAIGLFCVGLEILIDLFLTGKILLIWSSIVFTVCFIIDIALITLLSRARLRNAVRRRLHF